MLSMSRTIKLVLTSRVKSAQYEQDSAACAYKQDKSAQFEQDSAACAYKQDKSAHFEQDRAACAYKQDKSAQYMNRTIVLVFTSRVKVKNIIVLVATSSVKILSIGRLLGSKVLPTVAATHACTRTSSPASPEAMQKPSF